MARVSLPVKQVLEAIHRRTGSNYLAKRLLILLVRYTGDLAPEVADAQGLVSSLKEVLHSFSHEDSKYVLGPASAPNWIGLPAQIVGNLRALNVADLADLVSDGIPVAWVPRPSILTQLMTVGASGRVDLLLGHESEILDDCTAAIGRIAGGPLAELAGLLTEATIAARAVSLRKSCDVTVGVSGGLWPRHAGAGV